MTGSTSGIGAAIAAALAAEGASVVVSGQDAARVDSVVAAIRDVGGTAVFAGVDLAGDLVAIVRHLGGPTVIIGRPIWAGWCG